MLVIWMRLCCDRGGEFRLVLSLQDEVVEELSPRLANDQIGPFASWILR